MSPRLRTSLLVGLAVAMTSVSVWLVGHQQRTAVTGSFNQTEAAQGLLTAMLDQETGLRGYFQTGRRDFLAPFERGQSDFSHELGRLRRTTSGADHATHALIDRAEALGSRWNASAREAIVAVRLSEQRRPRVGAIVARKRIMDDFRVVDTRLIARIERRRQTALSQASTLSMLVVLGLSLLCAGAGWLAFGRRDLRRERKEQAAIRRGHRRAEFSETLQFMDSEEETHGIVKRHLESSLPGAEIVVLQRNNSADRLEATTPVDPGPLADALVDAEPRSCLAVRLGRRYETDGDAALVSCAVCGVRGTDRTTCTPLLVQGEVIGAVLAVHDGPLEEHALDVIDDTVAQAAPVIANMRNLAIAELRAATDSLTGLANRRSMQDTLRRMFALSVRSKTSLAAVALDLDHFKKVNDRFGHDRGDDVLAATAQALRSSLRTSDFVGRMGGEEFIVLLPETGLDGALIVAENLRRAISRLEIPGVDVPISASFGVAVSPEDASEPDLLLRQADRALYVAKENGRDRVEAAATKPPPEAEDKPQTPPIPAA